MADAAPIPETATDRDWADAWLYAVLGDKSITHGTNSTAALLRLHWNSTSLVSSPSLQGLADRSCQNGRTVDNQRKALRDAGLLHWTARPGRIRNDYHLLITPAVRRELARINPSHPAVVANQNHSGAAGVENPQPSPIETSTLGLKPAIPRPTASRTLKPIEPLRGAAPRAPDGAAVAARLGEPGLKLLQRIGPEAVSAWFRKVALHDGVVIVPTDMHANYLREKIADDMDFAFGPGKWAIRVERQMVAA